MSNCEIHSKSNLCPYGCYYNKYTSFICVYLTHKYEKGI